MSGSQMVTGQPSHRQGPQAGGRGQHLYAGGRPHPATLDVLHDMDFRYVDTRHEQAAVHMADAWAPHNRAAGRGQLHHPRVRQCRPRPGQRVPLRQSRGLHLRVRRPGPPGTGSHAGDRAGGHGLARYQGVVDGPRRPAYPRAHRPGDETAFSGRRGPVHLTIPMDVQEQRVSDEEVSLYQPREYRVGATSQARPELVRLAVDVLRQGSRPMIVVGGGGRRRRRRRGAQKVRGDHQPPPFLRRTKPGVWSPTTIPTASASSRGG